MFSAYKPEIVWKVDAAGLEKAAARLLLNLCILGVDAAPRGGTVTVEATDAAGGARLRIVTEGPRARLEAPTPVDARCRPQRGAALTEKGP